MRNFLKYTLVAVLLLSPALLRADELAEVARVSSSTNVKALDKKIKGLSKRINEGVRSGALSADKASELKADVQALLDKKKEYMDTNGAKFLTNDQLENLKQMWKQTAKKIHNAKHSQPSSQDSAQTK